MFSQISILASQGKDKQQTVTALSGYLGCRVDSYQVKFALRDSRTSSIPSLKKALAVLVETDYAVKAGTYDKTYLFDIAILRIAHEHH